jgi:hypothetical protein
MSENNRLERAVLNLEKKIIQKINYYKEENLNLRSEIVRLKAELKKNSVAASENEANVARQRTLAEDVGFDVEQLALKAKPRQEDDLSPVQLSLKQLKSMAN